MRTAWWCSTRTTSTHSSSFSPGFMSTEKEYSKNPIPIQNAWGLVFFQKLIVTSWKCISLHKVKNENKLKFARLDFLGFQVSQTIAWVMRTVWQCSEMILIRNITRLGPGMTRTATRSCPSSVSARQWRGYQLDNRRRWVLLKVQTNDWSFGSKRNCFIELLESFTHYFFLANSNSTFFGVWDIFLIKWKLDYWKEKRTL